MKKHFKNMAFLLAVLAIVLCAAVHPHDTQAATPKLNKAKVTLVKGEQVSLKVTGTAKKVRWSTSKKKVAIVTSGGLVKAKGKGTARITAKVGKKKLVCRVTIEAPKLNKSGLAVGIGKTAALKLTGTKGRVKWYTTDPNIAMVTQNGVVRGIGVGSCRVYAHVRGRGFPCMVSVRNLPPADPTWVPTPNPTITPTPTVQPVKTYAIGESWIVNGQWKVTVKSVEETSDRNPYSEKNPEAVYLVTYVYENIGYTEEYSDGLFISLEDTIVDSAGKMGYSYPGDKTLYAQETPVGATCEAQACIGVDNAGSFKIHVAQYDGNGNRQSAVFSIDL